ncbi:hypothetical protein PC118_g22625 [Phytophthora cactorum]|uniref:Uncharacterized protein n=1 Tax=Phytophthora cactorum TaxID=29920 RepID=A0A8T1AIZ7_9STRA|nr:hypothetical protein PC112_g22728 [Phytophthora cactorum]KAG2820410.1 hypothetical protein PC113_g22601 [Phytophthora cactorum]KAG2874332.1 hypothetical protein PC114_g25338 [Phytophthora cactorum]KAG2880380.1 hypothetical protein PC115_g22518 [Phytophthora cactorum]KAG2887654.1 hypothetical protein PC117_g25110 [Phytophthora cactorum]
MWDSSPRKQRGGKLNAKVTDAHVAYLLDRIDENCYLALDEMVDALEPRFEVTVSRQTIKHHIDGRMYTIKKTHCDSNYRNLPENRILCRDFIVDLLAYKSEGLAYSERNFGSFTSENCNKFFRRLLTHIARTTRHDNVRFLARHRKAILQVPPHRTIKAHREEYLKLAADLLVYKAITPYLCYKYSLHPVKFHARRIQVKDMPVGE